MSQFQRETLPRAASPSSEIKRERWTGDPTTPPPRSALASGEPRALSLELVVWSVAVSPPQYRPRARGCRWRWSHTLLSQFRSTERAICLPSASGIGRLGARIYSGVADASRRANLVSSMPWDMAWRASI
jgi:hypothetical protein